jgi:hypothetical protein
MISRPGIVLLRLGGPIYVLIRFGQWDSGPTRHTPMYGTKVHVGRDGFGRLIRLYFKANANFNPNTLLN